jgi:hypothetical protein
MSRKLTTLPKPATFDTWITAKLIYHMATCTVVVTDFGRLVEGLETRAHHSMTQRRMRNNMGPAPLWRNNEYAVGFSRAMEN